MARRERAPLPKFQSLSGLFARSQHPYAGADLPAARKFTASLWAVSAVLAAAFMPFGPPTGQVDEAGWPIALLIVALSLVGARWILQSGERIGFQQLLIIGYLGLAQTALLQWLAGGASPYRALFLVWLGAGVGTQTPRRGLTFIVAVVGFGCLPLAYSSGAHTRVDVATDALLWVTIGSVLLVLIARVRSQRASLQNVQDDARAKAEEAVRKVRGLESVADAALAHLPFDDLLNELLDRVCEVLDVERAAILLRDDDQLVLRAARGGGTTQPRRLPLGVGVAGQVTEESRPVFAEDISATRSMVWRDQVRSVLGVPLLVEGGGAIGVLQVGTSEGRRFSGDDAQLLQLAADRLAVAIDRARLNEQAHHIAATLQRSLLPSSVPEIPGLALATRYQPGADGAQVGGDLYDVVPYSDGRVGLAIGDVVGRGIDAASLMGQLRNALRAYALEDDRPEQVVERLNSLMHHWQHDRIATLLYLVIDPKTGHLSFASAGHLPPLVRAPDGSASYLTGGEYVPLGVLPFGGYRAGEAELEPGSVVFLYTDGLVEERGVSIADGLERLRAAAEAGPDEPHALCDHLLATVPPDGAAGDDVAVLATRLLPVDETKLELSLPAEPESLALMRRSLERWLNAVGVVGDLAYEITVACGEACMNAVEHAYPPGDAVFQLRAVNEAGAIDITVRDFGYWRPPRKGGERGRGLELMRRLMDSVKVVPGPEGTAVHLRRRLRREALAL